SKSEYFAAFSGEGGSSHEGGANNGDNSDNRGDNLNHYIAQGLGIYLTSAVKIDDLGQIIAVGTLDGKPQDFLLTPNGQPIPAPEPTTLVTLATASVGIMIH